MNTINVTVLRNHLSDTLDELADKKDFLLVARRGRIASALVNIEMFEDLLALANSDYLQTIKQAREQYAKGEVFTHEEVFGSL